VNYADLADMLAPVGLTVLQPGEATAALPCISLEPLGFSLLPGVATTFDRCNISVRYPIGSGDPATFDQARTSAAAAIALLKGTAVVLEADVDILADNDLPTPVFKFQISVAFPGISLCPDPADPEPDPKLTTPETEE